MAHHEIICEITAAQAYRLRVIKQELEKMEEAKWITKENVELILSRVIEDIKREAKKMSENEKLEATKRMGGYERMMKIWRLIVDSAELPKSILQWNFEATFK